MVSVITRDFVIFVCYKFKILHMPFGIFLLLSYWSRIVYSKIILLLFSSDNQKRNGFLHSYFIILYLSSSSNIRYVCRLHISNKKTVTYGLLEGTYVKKGIPITYVFYLKTWCLSWKQALHRSGASLSKVKKKKNEKRILLFLFIPYSFIK